MSEILALGCAVPNEAVEQMEATRHVSSSLALDERRSRWLERVSRNANIKKRHLAVPLAGPQSSAHLSASQRAALYLKKGPPLAYKAIENCLSGWGEDPKTLTHLVTVSCTGAVAPGLECLIIDHFGLDRYCERLAVNFMGCYGAFKGLQVAQALAERDRSARVLVCCLELCSLHLHPTEFQDTLVANTLFADGSAAAIIGQAPGKFSLIRHASYLIPDTTNEMRWDTGDLCYQMRMSSQVPVAIEAHGLSFVKRLLASNTTIENTTFAVHPGGKKIVQAIEKACSLQPLQTAASWNVLSEYGNMSSPTVLFVLDKLTKTASKDWVVMLGFGPGLTVEGYLLRRNS